MKTTLILNAINPGVSDVLIRNSVEAAKSTAVRSPASFLTLINVLADYPSHRNLDNFA